MISALSTAWRNLVKRLAVDWLILTAALVTVLLAMILLAAGPIYAQAVTMSGLQRTLADAPAPQSSVVAEARLSPPHYDAMDRIATSGIEDALDGAGPRLTRVLESETVELPNQPADGATDLGVFRWVEAIDEHAELTAGTWPGPGSSQTAIPESVGTALGLVVGDELEVIDRRDPSRVYVVEVSGIYSVTPTDPFWLEDPLATSGVTESASFRTFGPLVVTREHILGGLTERLTGRWRAHIDFSDVGVSEASSIRGGLDQLGTELDQALAFEDGIGGSSGFSVHTGLPGLLADTGRALTVTRSSVTALLIQLAILAGYALALTAGLLVDTRRTETSLLRARGASPSQLAAVAGFEAALLTIPAVLVAPWLAARTLDLLNQSGPLAALDLDLDPMVTTEARSIVVLAAVAAVIALTWPALRSARASHYQSRRGGRQRSRSSMQRAGVDFALVGMALLGFWQLHSLGPEVAARVQGRFGVDPVLVAAPALGLIAGAVLALRVVPLLARVAERIAGAGRGAVAALSAWQMARRPLRYARSALLLIMAVGIGFFAASYSTTWLASQRDQATFQVGADIRLQPNRRTGDSITDLHLVSAHEALSGVTRSMPVVRANGPLPSSDLSGEFILLDAAAAQEVVQARSDLAPGLAGSLAELERARPRLSGIALPGEPNQVSLMVDAEENLEGPEGQILPTLFSGMVSLVVQDSDGMLSRIELGAVEGPGEAKRLVADLLLVDEEISVSPAYPLTVVDIEIATPTGFDPRAVVVSVSDLAVPDGSGGWSEVPVDWAADSWTEVTAITGRLFTGLADAELHQGRAGLQLEAVTGAGNPAETRVVFALRPTPHEIPDTYPVIVSDSWLAESQSRIGDVLALEALRVGGAARARVAGAVDVFPTVAPGAAQPVIADLPTIQVLRYAPGAVIEPVDEHWLAVQADDARVADALLAPPLDSVRVLERDQVARSLATDPVALGTVGALTIGFLAAAVFAAVGFAVSATVSARERITEFGLLRALGLSPRQLGAWMTLEQGTLVISSLAFGTLVGWVLTATILPLVAVTQAGARAVPEVVVVYPWQTVWRLELLMIAVLAVIVVVMTLLLRRIGLGSLLRLGED